MSCYSANDLIRRGKTIITAHSGCENTPDNSLAHIRAALASGAEMIEVDLRMAPDGTLYLSHDVPEDIRERPLLSQLYELVAGNENVGVNLDVKTEGLIEPSMALAGAYGLTGRILFTGECWRDRALAVSLGAEVWHNVEGEETIEEGLGLILRDGSPYLNVRYTRITEENNRLLRSHGRGFSAWTINDEENLRRYLTMGVANITTRIPVLAMKLRKEIQGV
ncbi:MAG: glycerophosphodiester phosphodiesterase [Clostridia bacterium]|nr:glycerophosphodiester phosphodiesterase [Clostridia bacterium]